MWATASFVVVGCCRWRTWLLKYIICEILCCKERKVKVTMSLRTLRSLRWNRERQPSICVYLSSSGVNQRKSASKIIVKITGFWYCARNGNGRECARALTNCPSCILSLEQGLELMRESGEPMECGIFDFYKVFSRAFGGEEDGGGGIKVGGQRPWTNNSRYGCKRIPTKVCLLAIS